MREREALRVAVIGGGANDEHDVSLASAAAVTRALRALGHDAVPVTIDRFGAWLDPDGVTTSAVEAIALLTACDVAFPVLHGENGEDGSIAGLLSMTGVPFAGSPVGAGAVAMDKWVTKLVAEAIGVRTAPAVLVRGSGDTAPLTLDPPLVVKPTTGGSSNGVAVVREAADLGAAVGLALAAGRAALVETFVVGREIDIALFRDAGGILRAGATLEIGVADGAVFDREQKYDGTASFTLPARITADEHAEIERAARALYDTLGCAGVARFDFFVTATGVVLNEVNTTPGFTEASQVPRMYAALGLGYEQLVEALLDAALTESPTSVEIAR
ncbi:D-alanine--D-alanine ligase family protein [Leifsonia aquatica]|uniref:D-alanine--D-alanine ligase n=2 Tax=Leifsonia aquatica TaxID=144185 RepID=U2T5C9_LEIAQ|nr:D-alanine--D-alanine ligase [Leifsonia aquatica]ERK72698.1 D-ala D-ala ligase protein [Leifsonia aquatica ATCC 14665]MBB2968615.1 D-alanine-D-alanine ligase [Leifsonia aquatica]